MGCSASSELPLSGTVVQVDENEAAQRGAQPARAGSPPQHRHRAARHRRSARRATAAVSPEHTVCQRLEPCHTLPDAQNPVSDTASLDVTHRARAAALALRLPQSPRVLRAPTAHQRGGGMQLGRHMRGAAPEQALRARTPQETTA